MACNCKKRNEFVDANGVEVERNLAERILGTTKNIFTVLLVCVLCVVLTPLVVLYVIVSFIVNGGEKVMFPGRFLKKTMT